MTVSSLSVSDTFIPYEGKAMSKYSKPCYPRWSSQWSGSRDSHPDRLLHRERCCCYTTILRENPKAEFANPKKSRNSKPENSRWPIRVLDFGLLSDFDRRISDFQSALSRGLAPRTSAFAERRAELITP